MPAPHLVPVEAANILRRATLAGDLQADTATPAHDDLVRVPVHLFPYELHAVPRLAARDDLTADDAWYVALAETLAVSLVTLHRRIARAHGPAFSFRLPPERSVL